MSRRATQKTGEKTLGCLWRVSQKPSPRRLGGSATRPAPYTGGEGWQSVFGQLSQLFLLLFFLLDAGANSTSGRALAESVGMSGTSCSDLERYVQWLEEFASLCRPKEERTFFEDCSWVHCDCLWGSLSAPVPDSEVVACFEQGMKVERISKYAQQFTFALMQTCRARTLTLSEPCGECDQYRTERAECQPPTLEELMRRNGSLNGTNLTNDTLGSSAGSKSAKSSIAARRTGGGGRDVILVVLLLLLFFPLLLSPRQQDN